MLQELLIYRVLAEVVAIGHKPHGHISQPKASHHSICYVFNTMTMR